MVTDYMWGAGPDSCGLISLGVTQLGSNWEARRLSSAVDGRQDPEGVHVIAMHRTARLHAPLLARGLLRPKALFLSGLMLAMVVSLALGVQVAVAAETLVDAGLENGTDGAVLASPPWAVVGVPQHSEYDNTRAKTGAMSAWIQGTSTTSLAGAVETASGGMTSNGAELRFWLYTDSTNQPRELEDFAPGVATADRAMRVYFGPDGKLYVMAGQAGNPNGYTTASWTPVGTYSTGWTEYRVVYTFTGAGAQTYTLSKRANSTDPWTQLKAAAAAGYAIPFRSTNTITATHGTMWRGASGAQMWIDDLRYADSGITDGGDTVPPAVPSGLVATPGAADVALSWSANTEPDLLGYKIYKAGVQVAILPAATTSYTDFGLLTGTYFYQVSAIDSSGNESARSASVSATVGTPPSETLVDAGLENGTDGSVLASPPWTVMGAPQHSEYDNARAKTGAMSAWIQGTSTASLAGAVETASGGMTANGAELRFWLYMDSTNQPRELEDFAPGVATADRAMRVYFGPDGKLYVMAGQAGNPNGYTTASWTPVGTYSTGWTEYRVVYTFTGAGAQTYTLSKRANSADAWTPLKAAAAAVYAIPFRGTNTITATHGTMWRGASSAQMWIDDLRYVNPGAPAADTQAPSAPASLSAEDHPADSGDAIDLSWAAATDNVGVTGYKLYRGTSPGVYDAPVALPVSTNYTDNSATAGTRYYYAVSAVDAAGNESSRSPEASAIGVDNTAPAVPSGLAATPGAAEVALTWSANAEGDLAGYHVYSGGVRLTVAPTAATSYADLGLLNGTYSYQVSAVDTSGNESARCAVVLATVGTPPPSSSTLVDAGLENGTEGALLSSPPWTVIGAPQHTEYDSARAKTGAMSAWIQGTSTASLAGAVETASGGMSANGAELRFWLYMDSTNQPRELEDFAPGVATVDRAMRVLFGADGNLYVMTGRAGNPNGYTTGYLVPVGSYSVGWTEYRIVYTFTGVDAQTYTLSKRANSADAWTPLKATAAAGYAIPFRGTNTITATHGTMWRGASGAQMWIDELGYSDSGFEAPAADTQTPSAPASLSAVDHPSDSGGAIDLSWAAATDNVGVTGYKIYRGTSPGVYNALVTVPSATSYTDPSATTGTLYYYVITAVDAAGNESARSPEASGVAADNGVLGSDMSVQGYCGNCHARPATHLSVDPCDDCHAFASKHPGTPASLHLPADVTACVPCHNSSLTIEHNGRLTTAGTPVTCVTCHQSSDPNVMAGIASSNSACMGCHPTADHSDVDAVHTTVPGQTCYASGCHPATATQSLNQTHLNASAVLGGATRTSCQVCHWNGTPTTHECASCHADRVDGTHGGSTAHTYTSGADAVATGDAGCANSGSGCHGTDATYANFTEYHPNTGCSPGGACHTSPSKATYAGNGDCQSCHDGSFTNAPTRATLATDHYNETTHTATGMSDTVSAGGSASATCSTCHNPAGGLYSQHTNITPPVGSTYGTTVACVECHNDTDVSGNIVMLAGWTNDACSDCHSVTSAAPQHGTSAPVVNTTSTEGCGASGTECHTTYNVHELHANAAGGCTISGCHDAAEQGLKPTLTTCGEATGCHTNAADLHSATPHAASPASETVTISGASFGPVECDTCHADRLDIQGGHTATQECSMCHPSPKNTLTPAWDKSCAQGGCHTAGSTAPMHASIDASHAPVAGQTCYDASCHPATASQSLAETHRSASRVAGGETRNSCEVCHWNGTPTTAACGDCHPGRVDGTHGAATVHTFTVGADAVATGDAGCTNSGSGCHGTDATYGSFSDYHPATGCTSGACHTSPSKATYAGNGDCQTCHDGSFTGAPTRATLATDHYNETTHTATGMSDTVSAGGSASATCSTCHNPAGGLYSQHTNITPPAGSTYGTTVACVECHNDTDVSGNIVMLAGWTNDACSDCHSVTSAAPQHGTSAPVVNTTSTEGCGASGTNCHTTYNVHELHANAAGGCTISGCHDATKQGLKPTLTTCGEATGCHTNAADLHSATPHMASPASETITISGASFGPVECDTCHADRLDIQGGHTATQECSMCHPSPKNTLTPSWDKSCAQGGCHTAGSTAPMHASIDASHAPIAGQTCYDSSCHPATAGQSLAETHRNASSVLGGETRTSCEVCHWDGTPASGACADCHPSRVDGTHGAATVHTFTVGADAVAAGDAGCTNSGSGCHGTDATLGNFSDYHPATGCTSGACHTSPSKATYAGNGDCQSCHDGSFTNAPTRATLATDHYNETTHTATGMSDTVSAGGSASATCSTCHNPAGGLYSQHTGITPPAGSTYGTTVACVECHNDTDVSGNIVMLAGWTNDACSDCHSVTSAAPQHGTSAPVVNATSSQGCGASGTSCHTTYNVHSIHKDAAAGCTLSNCHDSGAQGLKPSVTTCGEATGCHTPDTFHVGITGTDATHTADAMTTVWDGGNGFSGNTCSDCHASGLKTAHDKTGPTSNLSWTNECTDCHNSTSPVNGSAVVASGWTPKECGTCHTTKHDVYSTNHTGQPTGTNTCTGCHPNDSLDLRIVHTSAITSGSPSDTGCGIVGCHNTPDTRPANKTCGVGGACHTDKFDGSHGSATAHTFTSASDYNNTAVTGCTNSGAGCHDTESAYGNFTDYHPNTGCAAGACHTSPSKPTYAGDHECVSCHNGQFTNAPDVVSITAARPDGHYPETTHTITGMSDTVTAGGTASATCATCHSATGATTGMGGLYAQHQGVTVGGSTTSLTCSDCHNKSAEVSAIINGTWTQACSACHTASVLTGLEQHGTTAPNVTATPGTYQGFNCVSAGCHADDNLHAIHKDTAAGCTQTGCHDSAAQGLKPTGKSCGTTGTCHTAAEPHDAGLLTAAHDASAEPMAQPGTGSEVTTASATAVDQSFPNATWPADWTRGSTQYIRLTTTAARVHSTPDAAELYASSTTRRTFQFYKDIDLTTYQSATLTFWDYTAGSFTTGDFSRSEYSTNGGSTWTDISYLTAATAWTQRTISLPVGGVVRIRFGGSVNATTEFCNWDDILVTGVTQSITTGPLPADSPADVSCQNNPNGTECHVVSDVRTVHSALPSYCANCHKAGGPVKNCQTSGCHTPQFINVDVHNSTNHGTNLISTAVGEPFASTGIDSTTCTGCHDDAIAVEHGLLSGYAATPCSVCHKKATDSGAPTNVTAADASAAIAKAAGTALCTDCHKTVSSSAVHVQRQGATATPGSTQFDATWSGHKVYDTMYGSRTGGTGSTFNGQATSISWTLPTATSWLKAGWTTPTQAVRCSDCHGAFSGATGPHGSSMQVNLAAGYDNSYSDGTLTLNTSSGMSNTTNLCAKCHTTSLAGYNDPHGEGNHSGEPCTLCHTPTPHSWKRPRLLGYTTDPVPYRTSGLVGIAVVSHTAGTWAKGNCQSSCGGHNSVPTLWP